MNFAGNVSAEIGWPSSADPVTLDDLTSTFQLLHFNIQNTGSPWLMVAIGNWIAAANEEVIKCDVTWHLPLSNSYSSTPDCH